MSLPAIKTYRITRDAFTAPDKGRSHQEGLFCVSTCPRRRQRTCHRGFASPGVTTNGPAVRPNDFSGSSFPRPFYRQVPPVSQGSFHRHRKASRGSSSGCPVPRSVRTPVKRCGACHDEVQSIRSISSPISSPRGRAPGLFLDGLAARLRFQVIQQMVVEVVDVSFPQR